MRSTHTAPAPAFRAAIGSLPTGVSIVSAGSGAQRWATTIGTLTSLSLEPPLVLFCLRLGSPMLRHLTEPSMITAPAMISAPFAISVLGADQHHLADLFAGPRTERSLEALTAEVDGVPVVAGASAWITCTPHRRHDEGDHAIVIGAVRHTEVGTAPPLVRHTGRYRTLL
ncbi:flavin reductase family protein [Actinokineospora globicatena]|uniref:Oxidoreductase n=1 Tax=Actinokineospora globicatena TaxID=103729 RepID=A0A9W6V8M7_9PSEU|nr:flavin reductase family protein [Actinokineospora globicatena]GLW90126.1 oxidoreductase [Actinokineospora globicatena]